MQQSYSDAAALQLKLSRQSIQRILTQSGEQMHNSHTVYFIWRIYNALCYVWCKENHRPPILHMIKCVWGVTEEPMHVYEVEGGETKGQDRD